MVTTSYPVSDFLAVSGSTFIFNLKIPVDGDRVDEFYFPPRPGEPITNNNTFVIQNCVIKRLNGYYSITSSSAESVTGVNLEGVPAFTSPLPIFITGIDYGLDLVVLHVTTSVPYYPGDYIVVSGVVNVNGRFRIQSTTSNSITIKPGSLIGPPHLPVPVSINFGVAISGGKVQYTFSSTQAAILFQFVSINQEQASSVIITGMDVNSFNGTFTVSNCTYTTFTVFNGVSVGASLGGGVLPVQSAPLVKYPNESAYVQKFTQPSISTSSGIAGSDGIVDFVFQNTNLPYAPFLDGGYVSISRCIPKSFVSTGTTIHCTTTGMSVQYKADLIDFSPGDRLTTQAVINNSAVSPSNEFRVVARQQVNSLFGSTGATLGFAAGTTIAELNAAGIVVGAQITVWGFSDSNYNVSGAHAGTVNFIVFGNMNGYLPQTINGHRESNLTYLQYDLVSNVAYNNGVIENGFCVAGTSQTVVANNAYRVGVTNSESSKQNKFVVQGSGYQRNGGEALSITNDGTGTFNGQWSVNHNEARAIDLGTGSSPSGVSAILRNGDPGGNFEQYLEMCLKGNDSQSFGSLAATGDAIFKSSGNMFFQKGNLWFR